MKRVLHLTFLKCLATFLLQKLLDQERKREKERAVVAMWPPPLKVNGPDIGGAPSPVVWGVGSVFPLWGGCGFWGFGCSLSF